MNSSYKKLIIVFIVLLLLVVVFNYQHQFALTDISSPLLILFITVMAILIWTLRPVFDKIIIDKDIKQEENSELRSLPSKEQAVAEVAHGKASPFESNHRQRGFENNEAFLRNNSSLSDLLVSSPPDLILIVEDDPINTRLISEVLRKLGIASTVANSGEEALEQVQQHNPALIFMDVNMPVMNGITFTSLIRSLPEPYCNIPIIALSTDIMKEDIINCLNAGMNSFITSPPQIKEITDALKLFGIVKN